MTMSLYDFVKQSWHVFHGTQKLHEWPHVEVICDHLEALVKEEMQRLIINIPPGHGLSWLLTKARSWAYGLDPAFDSISLCYAKRAAQRNNQRVKQLINSEWYQEHFRGTVVSREPRGSTVWSTTEHGVATAWGSDHKVQPDRCERLFADTPQCMIGHNNAQGAGAFGLLVDNVNWTDSRAAIVLGTPRISPDDLTANLIARYGLWSEDNPDGWNYLCLPCEATGESKSVTKLGLIDERKKGEVLAPEIMSPERVKREKENPYKWAAQYQQDPIE